MPAGAPSRVPPSARRLGLAAAAALALAAVGERGAREVYRDFLLPARDAEWIWAPPASLDGRPRDFYAAADVDLPFQPVAARVVLAADEGYQLFVNGELVGSNVLGPEPALDAYEVADLLRAGSNRLVAELRSERGLGGFVLVLTASAADGRAVRAATGRGWRIFRRARRALADPDSPLDEGARPLVWGPAPVARWAGPLALRPLPVAAGLLVPPALPPEAVLPWEDAASPRPPGRAALYDFGREVVGYLLLRSAGQEDGRLAAVYLGEAVPDPLRQKPDAYLVPLPGRPVWQDLLPRRFRYALVVGPAPVGSVAVLPVEPQAAAPLLAPGRRRPGVFGLEPPRLRTAVENEVWGEVERLQGRGGREGR